LSEGVARERGTLFVVSAPSGTGKTTLSRRLLESVTGLAFSVSYTTRARRAGEESGREYHFVDDAGFDALIGSGGFLEWAHVFGSRYGTGRQATEAALSAGTDLLLDIDVQGAAQIRATGLDAVFVFILPPDFEALASRLRLRASEDDGALRRRLGKARQEAMEYDRFDYTVVNAEVEEASQELIAIVRAERARTVRRRRTAAGIVSTFPAPMSGA